MTAIDIIGSHVSSELIKKYIKSCNAICSFTGQHITEGISVKDAIPTTFTDQAFMKYTSEYVSVNVAKCIMSVLPMQKEADGKTKEYANALRNYSFIATENELRFMEDKADILATIKSLPTQPFVLCISYSRKKHIAFKAHLNLNSDYFYIDTDTGSFQTDYKTLILLLSIAERWYSIVPNPSKELPTFFTKDEIGGSINIALHKAAAYIEIFGDAAFKIEQDQLRKFHNTPLLQFITFIIQKNA